MRAGDRGLTLDQVIKRCLANPRILAGREAIEQAKAEVQAAALIPNPSLCIEAGMLPLSRRFSVEEPGGPTELAGGLSFPIDWLVFGKRTAAVASAEAAVAVAEAEHADLARRQVTETVQAFHSVLEAEALLEVARQAQESLGQTEGAIRTAVESGGHPQIELSRVRLELQTARREERNARAAVIAAKAALRALLGETGPAGALEIAGTLDGPLTFTPLPVEEAFAIAAENRPDLLALRRKGAQAQRDVVVEGRNALPETTLGFGMAHQFQRAIGAPDVTAWGATIEIALPVFDRNQGNRARAESVAVQIERELEAALAELRGETEQAVNDLGTALENAQAVAQTELDLASQVRDSVRKAYGAGGRSFVELIDAERIYRETYQAYVTSRADYWRSLARYEACLGRNVIP